MPTLRPGDIVVMATSRLAQERPLSGGPSAPPAPRLFFLPKYSPDLMTQIEMLFSKLKHLAAQGRCPNPGRPYANAHRQHPRECI